MLRRVIDLVEQFAPAGADPLTVFETIERAPGHGLRGAGALGH